MDDGISYKIRLKLDEIPRDDVVETWARLVCEEINIILLGKSIERNVRVKVYADLMGGKRTEYGEAVWDSDRRFYDYIHAK